MFCKYCGQKLDENLMFCSKCGEKIGKSNETNEKSDEVIDKKTSTVNLLEKTASKNSKTIAIISVLLIFSLMSIIPIVKHHNNTNLDSQLKVIENGYDYFINSITLISNDTLQISFSDNPIWDNKSVKKLNCNLMIFESGAVIDMDKNGKLDLVKGYSSYPGSEYSAVSNEERKKEGFENSSGYYNLCINYLSVDRIKKELKFILSEDYKFDENRIYNFHIEINNPSDGRLFNYDCYFRYSDGNFNKVKNTDLKPEDTYFAWHNNELHFARFGSMSEEGYPCYQISDETYEKRN